MKLSYGVFLIFMLFSTKAKSQLTNLQVGDYQVKMDLQGWEVEQKSIKKDSIDIEMVTLINKRDTIILKSSNQLEWEFPSKIFSQYVKKRPNKSDSLLISSRIKRFLKHNIKFYKKGNFDYYLAYSRFINKGLFESNISYSFSGNFFNISAKNLSKNGVEIALKILERVAYVANSKYPVNFSKIEREDCLVGNSVIFSPSIIIDPRLSKSQIDSIEKKEEQDFLTEIAALNKGKISNVHFRKDTLVFNANFQYNCGGWIHFSSPKIEADTISIPFYRTDGKNDGFIDYHLFYDANTQLETMEKIFSLNVDLCDCNFCYNFYLRGVHISSDKNYFIQFLETMEKFSY